MRECIIFEITMLYMMYRRVCNEENIHKRHCLHVSSENIYKRHCLHVRSEPIPAQ
uniref:Uncharacterized protein n=1 Tax=Octopus bimaculoides TaxID=37653 RepID=A0A0L8IBG5_OCTBM